MRLIVFILAVLYLAVAAVLLAWHVAPLFLLIHLTLSGIFLLGAILVERSRYSPAARRGSAAWNPTGERFVDPTSRRLIEVRENPRTGERAYVDIGPAPAEPAFRRLDQASRRRRKP